MILSTDRSSFAPFLLALFVFSVNSQAQQAQPLRGRLSLPDKSWGVAVELPGFTLKTVETKPDGRRYMLAENEKAGFSVSLTLEHVAENGSGNSCRASLESRSKNPAFKVQDVRFSKSGDFEVMQYRIPSAAGMPVNQQNLFACEFYDNTYIDLHVSKVKYAPADDALFAEVLASTRVDKGQRSSRDLLGEGSGFFLKQDYKNAIGPYSQALLLEKSNPQLGKPLWYVLVDNLGMAYGITGDLQKAKETFEYGVSKDATYPLFYYNLACTYAEMNDGARATNYLKKAFEYKNNTLEGETMPDPRTDDSFQKLMRDKDFRELAESLAKAR